MSRLNELRMIARVAQMYHVENQRQADIANHLRISQATVSRMLKRAQEGGWARYPVFTDKRHTDIAYLACARVLIERSDRLLPQYSRVAGGLLSVRGYPQSVAVGDTVHLWSAEYRFHIPRSLPVDTEPLKLPGIGDFRTPLATGPSDLIHCLECTGTTGVAIRRVRLHRFRRRSAW